MTIQISFIVPIYNTENELARCIESLLSVPVEKEIILIDDGSTDNSFNVAQQYFKQHSNIILLQQHNSGVAKARNRGITLACGKYLQFVDSDDYLINQYHYTALIELADKQQADVVKMLIQVEGPSLFLTHLPITRAQRYSAQTNAYICSGIDYLDKMVESWFPSPCNGLYRTELLKNQKIFFPEYITQSEDSLFNFDVFSQPNLKVIDTKIVGYLYCYRPTSASHQSVRVEHVESICKLCEQFLQRISTFSQEQGSNSQFYKKIIDYATHIILIELKRMYRSRYLNLNEQEKIQAKNYFSPKLIEIMRVIKLDI